MNQNFLKVIECKSARKNAVISLGLVSIVLYNETFSDRLTNLYGREIKNLREFYLFQKQLNPNLN